MTEAIEKCRQSAAALVASLETAYGPLVNQPMPPQGRSPQDNALRAYLADRLEAACKLQSDLMRL